MLSRSNNYNPVEGSHPKIISIAKFKRLNSTRFTTQLKRTKDSIINELLPLKGYLKCQCGAKFTGYYSKKKKRPYYICNNFECRTSLPAIFMSDSFKEQLKNQLPIELSNHQLISKLSSFITELSKINEDLVIEQKATLNKAKEKLYKLADALMDGELDKKIFKERYTELENKVAEEEQKLFDLDVHISNHGKVSETIIKFFRNSVSMWENGDLHVKRQIQKIFYSDGIIYSKSEGQYRTFRKNSLLHLMNMPTSIYTKKSGLFN